VGVTRDGNLNRIEAAVKWSHSKGFHYRLSGVPCDEMKSQSALHDNQAVTVPQPTAFMKVFHL